MAGRDLGAFTRYTDLGNPKERPSLFCPSREACNIFGLETVREANCDPKRKLRTDERYILRDEFGELSGGKAFCDLRIFPQVGRMALGRCSWHAAFMRSGYFSVRAWRLVLVS